MIVSVLLTQNQRAMDKRTDGRTDSIAISIALYYTGARWNANSLTRRLHVTTGCTAGCTTSWVNYANELSQAALERSSQDAYGVIAKC